MRKSKEKTKNTCHPLKSCYCYNGMDALGYSCPLENEWEKEKREPEIHATLSNHVIVIMAWMH